MPAEDPEFSFQQPRSLFGTWVGIVLLFAIFGLFVWVVMGAMPRGDDYEQKRAAARMEKLKTTKEQAATALQKYGWVDKNAGVARLPIRRAMELSVTELAQKKPAPANPIATEPTQPGPQAGAPVAPPASTVSPGAAAAASAPPKATSITGKDSENRGQAAATSNPPNAAPGTQPGPNATPAASPPSGASRPQPGVGQPTATPVQSPPGTPLPVRGKTP